MKNDYIAQALVTRSNQFHGQLIDNDGFLIVLRRAIAALQVLDLAKKALFYGKANLVKGTMLETDVTQFSLNWIDNVTEQNDSNFTHKMHAILGVATEGGELLEALLKSLTVGNEETTFDNVNLLEEAGDVQWYVAGLLNELGSSFEHVQDMNIAKLRLRYKDKFDAFDATNRDLDAERKNLEANQFAPGEFGKLREQGLRDDAKRNDANMQKMLHAEPVRFADDGSGFDRKAVD